MPTQTTSSPLTTVSTMTALPSPTSALTLPPTISPETTTVFPRYSCPYADLKSGIPVYQVQVVNTFPHNPLSYTQGLIYRDGLLYESTGQYGESALLQIELASGEILQRHNLSDDFFGEGMTEFDRRLYQLTYRESIGFIYDPQTFQVIGRFPISSEGWGLDHNGEHLVRSDGSNLLYFLDPVTLETVRTLAVDSPTGPVEKVNELEYIEGEIWANIFLTSCIVRIDSQSGAVKGWVDLGNLLTPEEALQAEMPNGIAYDSDNKRIFITGKYWPKLFEIKLIPVN